MTQVILGTTNWAYSFGSIFRNIEQKRFKDIEIPLRYSNLSSEQCGATRFLADGKSIVIKNAEKGSVVVVWDIDEYVEEAQKQLGDENNCWKVNCKEKLLFFKEVKKRDAFGLNFKIFYLPI